MHLLALLGFNRVRDPPLARQTVLHETGYASRQRNNGAGTSHAAPRVSLREGIADAVPETKPGDSQMTTDIHTDTDASYRKASDAERAAWEALVRHRAGCTQCQLAAQVEPFGLNTCAARRRLLAAWSTTASNKFVTYTRDRQHQPRGHRTPRSQAGQPDRHLDKQRRR